MDNDNYYYDDAAYTSQVNQPSYQRRQTSRSNLSRLYEEQPLVVGAVVALLGATLALLVPTTRYEDEVLGVASDTFVQDAKQAARDVGDVAKESVSQAAETFKDEVSSIKPDREEVKATTRDFIDSLSEAAKKSGEAAQRVAKEEVDKRNLS